MATGKVFDRGGLPCMLAAFIWAVEVSAAPYTVTIGDGHADALYRVGEKARFTLTAKDLAKDAASSGGVVSVTMDNFGGKVLLRKDWSPSEEPVLTVEGSLDEPGFLRVTAMTRPRPKGSLWGIGKGNVCWSVGYEPEKIKAGSARPADFDAYWDGERARLEREVPLDMRKTKVDAMCDDSFDVWKLSCATFNGKRTWGFLVVPKQAKGPLPLHINVPGAGPALSEAGTKSFKKPGEIHLILNVHPYEPAKDIEGQKTLYQEQDRVYAKKYGCNYAIAGGFVGKEEFFFHDALLGIDRAVTWVVALPEVDRKKVLYSGGSQGGGMGIMLCALNPSITRACFFVPALTDLCGFKAGRQSGWPLLVERQRNDKAKEAAAAVAPYFDAAHFAPRVKIPLHVVLGFSDTTCPPACVYAAYNAFGSNDKIIRNVPGMGHGVVPAIRQATEEWLRNGSCAAQCAENGCEVKVSSLGFDPADSTVFLQKALDSGARRVVVDKQAGPWVTRPLLTRRCDFELVFEPGVEVVAKKGEFMGIGDSLIGMRGVKGVKIRGNGATLRMYRDDYMNKPYPRGEWRHALAFMNAKDLLIENLRIIDSGGDAIYLGASPNGACENVTIRGVTAIGNLRQGISVISAENLLVENCLFENTCGLPPMDGIDFEPNGSGQRIANCTIRNCTSRGNRGFGWDVAVFNLNSASRPVSVLFDGCVEEDNFGSLRVWCENRDFDCVRGKVVFRNCSFARPKHNKFNFAQNPDFPMQLEFENCRYIPKEGDAATDVPDWRAINVAPVLSGAPLTVKAVKEPDFKRAVVHDSSPGEMVPLSPFSVRSKCRYLFYAERARTVRFRGRQVRIGKGNVPHSNMTFALLDIKDKNLGVVAAPGFEEADFSVDVPAPGFYSLHSQDKQMPFALTASDAPVAINCIAGRVGMINSTGDLFFRPAGGVPFAITVSGDPSEKVGARLSAPNGETVWEQKEIYRSFRHVVAEPEEGLWTLSVLKPASGRFEDYKLDLTGIPGHLFLCRGKTWQVPVKSK